MLGRRFDQIDAAPFVYRQVPQPEENAVPRPTPKPQPMTFAPTRRRFVQGAAAASLTMMLSLPRRAYGANERLAVAIIGTTGRGGENLDEVAKVPGVELVALCDVDDKLLAKAATKPTAAKAEKFNDFREMFDAMGDRIDAVLVAAPDHIHAPAGLAAMRLKKHLYCEKPLAHNVREIRLMQEAAKKYNLATQMGTQIHAGENYRRVVELIRSGAIGPIRRVHNWVPTSYSGSQKNVKRPEGSPPVPKGLHWDLW